MEVPSEFSSRGGEALQRLEKIDTVVLDKTGTITEGRPQVTDVLLAAHETLDVKMGSSA